MIYSEAESFNFKALALFLGVALVITFCACLAMFAVFNSEFKKVLQLSTEQQPMTLMAMNSMMSVLKVQSVSADRVEPTAAKGPFVGESVERAKVRVPEPEQRRERDKGDGIRVYSERDVLRSPTSPMSAVEILPDHMDEDDAVEHMQPSNHSNGFEAPQAPQQLNCPQPPSIQLQQLPSLKQFLSELSKDPEVQEERPPTLRWEISAICADVSARESNSYGSSNHNEMISRGLDMYDAEPPRSVTPDVSGSFKL